MVSDQILKKLLGICCIRKPFPKLFLTKLKQIKSFEIFILLLMNFFNGKIYLFLCSLEILKKKSFVHVLNFVRKCFKPNHFQKVTKIIQSTFFIFPYSEVFLD